MSKYKKKEAGQETVKAKRRSMNLSIDSMNQFKSNENLPSIKRKIYWIF